MSANDEMRSFLNHLLRHQQECTDENCADCRTAQHVYEFTRNMIFSVVAYPQVALPGRRTAAVASTAGSVRKTSRRAA